MMNMLRPSTPDIPAPPKPEPPAPMPDPQSPEVMEAKRRAMADTLVRAGQASTVRTTTKASAGGFDTYGSKTLGAGG